MQKKHGFLAVWWLPLLAIFSILGLAVRRQMKRHKKLSNQQSHYQDGVRSNGSGSPYRDYFKKGNSVTNGKDNYKDGANIVLWDCEDEEHRPPPSYPFNTETELVNQREKGATGDRLDSSEWEEHGAPPRFAPSIREEHVDDYSFGISPLDYDSCEQSQQSRLKVHRGSSAADYLNSADMSMLRKYRQQNQGPNLDNLSRRKAEAEDTFPNSPRSSSFGREEDVLNDLQGIESQLI